MCRNIHTLHNVAPPASDAEVRAAALQFVRKGSASRASSKANTAAFEQFGRDTRQPGSAT